MRIEEQYITETNQRLAFYRRVAGARDEAALAAVLDEVADRYGPVPPSVMRLAQYGRIRVLADQLGAESVDREQHLLVIRFRDNAQLDPERLVAFVEARPAVTLTPPAVIRVDLDALSRSRTGPPRRMVTSVSASWWTKRASSGEVKAGFSKDELLRSERPGEADSLLDQVQGLLTDLSGPSLDG